jgi:hypothetical protein
MFTQPRGDAFSGGGHGEGGEGERTLPPFLVRLAKESLLLLEGCDWFDGYGKGMLHEPLLRGRSPRGVTLRSISDREETPNCSGNSILSEQFSSL